MKSPSLSAVRSEFRMPLATALARTGQQKCSIHRERGVIIHNNMDNWKFDRHLENAQLRMSLHGLCNGWRWLTDDAESGAARIIAVESGETRSRPGPPIIQDHCERRVADASTHQTLCGITEAAQNCRFRPVTLASAPEMLLLRMT